MPDPSSKRRWFRLSLRTLFVVVTVAACWLGYNVNWMRQRRNAIENGYVEAVGERPAPFALRMLGAPGYNLVQVVLPTYYTARAFDGRQPFPDQIKPPFYRRQTGLRSREDYERLIEFSQLFPEANACGLLIIPESQWATDGYLIDPLQQPAEALETLKLRDVSPFMSNVYCERPKRLDP